MPPPITLEQQAEKLARILDERDAHYRRAFEKGTRPLEWAAAKQAETQAIRASFQFLVDNQGWIRDEARRRAAAQRREAELAAITEELRADPAVATVLETFPGATIADVREIAHADT